MNEELIADDNSPKMEKNTKKNDKVKKVEKIISSSDSSDDNDDDADQLLGRNHLEKVCNFFLNQFIFPMVDLINFSLFLDVEYW